MKKTVAAAVLALMLGAGAASAQRIDSPYRFLDNTQMVNAYVGHIWMPDGRLQLGPQSAVTMGARWALRVSGPFSIAADVGFTPTKRMALDTALVSIGGGDSTYTAVGEVDTKLLTVMGAARVSLMGARTWHGLHPFIEIGGGVALDLAGREAIEGDIVENGRWDFGTSFAGQAGAGIEWFPSQRMSIRMDAKNVLWKLPVPEAFLIAEDLRGRRLSASEWENNLLLSVGLSIHF